MRAFLKFLINIGLIALLIWLVVRFTTLDDKIIGFFRDGGTSVTSSGDVAQVSCTTPWGVNIPNGSSIFAYQIATPDENGSCHEEERKCVDGVLKGSYTFGSCNGTDGGITTDSGDAASGNWTMPPTGAACTTPWGQTIAHGNYIVSYESPSSCRFQRRMCVDGQLLGKFQYNYCMIAYQGSNGLDASMYDPGGSIDANGNNYDQMQAFSNTVDGGNGNTNLTSPYANQGASRHYAPVNYGGNVANTTLPNDYWNQNSKGNVAIVDSSKIVNPLATNGVSKYTLPKDRRANNYTNYDLTQKGCTTPWGTFVQGGQYVIAYRAGTAAKGHSCEYERRNCINGNLVGSFSFPSCNFQGQKTYTYNTYQPQNQGYDKYYWSTNTIPTLSNRSCRSPRGTTVKDGDYVRSYKYSSAPWADGCEGEVRYCHDGLLDGSYSNQTCRLKQPTANGCYGRNCGTWNNSCSLPRGGTMSNGGSVTAYSSSYGQCRSETRTCSNGYLNGSYGSQYCQNYTPQDNNACSLPRGGSIANGQSVLAYNSRNGSCNSERRYCYNGSLNGSYTQSSCNNGGNSCSLPRGGSIANGDSVLAYNSRNGSCNSERRYCYNGSLNGSYTEASCNNGGNSCSLPRGGSIANGQSVLAYNSRNGVCNSERRYCTNGSLNGSYTQSSCSNGGNSCSLPRGGSIGNGQSVLAYENRNGVCNSERRYCTNGSLNGSYSLQYCAVTNNSCSLPRGGSINNGQSIEAFLNPTSPCTKEIRTCINGNLNGSYGYSSCNLTNTTCSLPRGGTINNGQSVQAYQSPTGPCTTETRTCVNGYLNGSYGYNSCSIIGGGSDTYGERQSAGRYDSVPDGSDSCHGDATAAFTCTAQDQNTCVDYRKVENDCCVAGRAKYEKRSVTCVR